MNNLLLNKTTRRILLISSFTLAILPMLSREIFRTDTFFSNFVRTFYDSLYLVPTDFGSIVFHVVTIVIVVAIIRNRKKISLTRFDHVLLAIVIAPTALMLLGLMAMSLIVVAFGLDALMSTVSHKPIV